MSPDISRRRFLEGTGVLTATAAASGLVTACGGPRPHEKYYPYTVPGFALSVDTLTKEGSRVVDEDLALAHFGLAQAVHARRIRIDFDANLASVASAPHYNWQPTDAIMNAAREKGLAVTALFSFTPPKFRHKLLRHEPAEDSYGNRPTPLGINNFAYFCAAAVERYNRGKYKLQYAEIWNEPNLSPSGADPAEYVELIKVTNAAIKNAKKDVQVSIGGLGPSANSGLWLSPPSFLQKLYDYGLLNTDYDAISVHPYSEDAGTVYYRWSTFSQIEATHPSIYSVLHENLADDKQIWLTEFGAPTKGPGKVHTLANPDVAAYNPDVDYVDPALQRAIVQKIFNYRFRNANVLPDHRYMYTLMDKPGGSNEDGYGAYDIRGNFKWARNHQAA